jgi:RNA polymerase sigma-54 factor
MVMELKQQLRMVQQLVMTPQLQQAIKLLQMSRLELVDSVHQELMENPVLEDTSELVPESDSIAQPAEWTASGSTPTVEQANARDDEALIDATRGTDKKNSEIDWERYLENHTLQGPVSFGSSRPQEELPNYEGTLTKSVGLTEHLMWQAHMSDFVEDELRFTELVVGNLDDRGFLTIEGVLPEEVVPKLAEEAEIHADDAEEVLKIIQRFDPVGVASRTLLECLQVQAKHFGLDQLVSDVLIHHLHDLERKDYQGIAKALNVSIDEVYDVAQVIAELEPRPARNYITEDPHYIVPDVYVHKVGDKYFVVANDDGMPKLKISRYYRSAMLDDKKAKEYIQNKLRSAQWLIRSIDQRRKTIERVTECIVEKQYDFFEKGIEYLKPMILRDVAEQVEMHESTISRVTSNKYVHTPRGLFELKFFFNSGIHRSEHEDIASESVKQAIKKIIESEDPNKPYSDQKIVEMLSDTGVVIARRTVTKYREMLRILSSSKRKKYF